MHQPLNPAEIANIQDYDVEQRYHYFIEEVTTLGQIWILTDKHGSVLLNTDDEDCVPVWPAEAFVKAWISDEWAGCQPTPISLKHWHSRWTPGLISDQLAIAIFPSTEEEGLVMEPDDLERALKQKTNR